MPLNLHKCFTEDGMAITCVCSTGRDHTEDEMDLNDQVTGELVLSEEAGDRVRLPVTRPLTPDEADFIKAAVRAKFPNVSSLFVVSVPALSGEETEE